MNKRLLLFCAGLLSLASLGTLRAQVKDASLSVAADVEYQWMDKNLNIDNAMFWGVRAGFGFGPIVELRATYDHSFGVKSKLNGGEWNINAPLFGKMADRNIQIDRLGAEMKFNLIDRVIASPYLSLGAGIQYMKYELPVAEDKIEIGKTQSLYASGTLGLKFNLGRRFVLSLAGRYIGYQADLFNPYVNRLSTKWNKEGLAVMHNISALASAEYYFGGYNAKGGNEVSRAYRDFFSNGYKGMLFTLEPSLMYVNYSDESFFPDSWFYGGQLGVDFNNTLGLRAFYYQAGMPNEKLNFSLNKATAMYGGYFTGRLNLPRGVTPYLNLGAGYLDTDIRKAPDALDKKNLKDAVFVMAGLGLEVPLFRWVSAFGSANLLMHPTPGLPTTSIAHPANIVAKNYAYQFGLRFNLGRVARHYQPTVAEPDQTSINEIRHSEYHYYNDGQKDDVARTTTEKSEYRYYNDGQKDDVIRMTPEEIEAMAQRIIDRNRSQKSSTTTQTTTVTRASQDALTPLERELVHALIGSQQYVAPVAVAPLQTQAAPIATTTTVDNSVNEKILDRLDAMERKIEQNNRIIREQKTVQPATTVVATPAAGTVATPAVHPTYATSNTATAVTPVDDAQDSFRFNSIGLITGVNFVKPKDQKMITTFSLGVRGYLPISNTNLDFIPEAFIGLWGKDQDGKEKTTFGISANVVYNLNLSALGNFVPYIGAGLGFYTNENPGINILLGTSYKLPNLNSAIFCDYGIRVNSLRNHSLMLGYRFYF